MWGLCNDARGANRDHTAPLRPPRTIPNLTTWSQATIPFFLLGSQCGRGLALLGLEKFSLLFRVWLQYLIHFFFLCTFFHWFHKISLFAPVLDPRLFHLVCFMFCSIF